MGFDFENIYKGTEDFPVGLFRQSMYISETHHHQEYELLFIAEGTATLKIEQKTFKTSRKDVFLIEPGADHSVSDLSSDFLYYAVIFDNSVFGSENEATRKTFENIIVNQRLFLPDTLLENIKKTTASLENNDFGKEIAVKNLMYEILLHVINTNQYLPLPEIQIDATGQSAIDNGLIYIKNHYRENICLEDLLNCTNYSKSHFIRLFKSSTGMNYTDYLNRFRIEKACRDLIYSNKNITEIATENGFNNIQYFSKIFKKYMECTPKQYQKKSKILG